MAKPKKDADRRARVEQMRREQERRERRQGFLVVGAAVLVGAIIIGFAAWQFVQAEQDANRPVADLGVTAADAGCQDVVTEDAQGSGEHRTEGEPIDYPQSPPAFGPHWGRFLSGNEIRKFWTVDDRPPVERLVHSLEHGHTILWYDETVAEDDEQVEALRDIAATFSGTGQEDKFMAAPWTSEDGDPFPDDTHVALTHWYANISEQKPDEQQGVWQYCASVSGEAVADFMAEWPAADSPEPAAA